MYRLLGSWQSSPKHIKYREIKESKTPKIKYKPQTLKIEIYQFLVGFDDRL